MSGGHWDYLSFKLEERARPAGEVWRLLAALEHELDWGLSGDSCVACARNRMGPALEAFFDAGCNDASTAIAVARDSRQHRCQRCEPRS